MTRIFVLVSSTNVPNQMEFSTQHSCRSNLSLVGPPLSHSLSVCSLNICFLSSLASLTGIHAFFSGDQAENHVGMQKIGQLATCGFQKADLEKAKVFFESKGIVCELIDLKAALPDDIVSDEEKLQSEPIGKKRKVSASSASSSSSSSLSSSSSSDADGLEAFVLIARNGVHALLEDESSSSLSSSPSSSAASASSSSLVDAFYREQDALPKDTKVLMYGRVVNKLARHNLCFGDAPQEPDYTHGKGRIIAFDQVPLLARLRRRLASADVLGAIAADMAVEGNYYYDPSTCGIGWHGDAERRKVVGVRVGQSLPLHYAWFRHSQPVSSDAVKLQLHHGDVYIMSEKATGQDWRCKNILTLRHSAGCDKYTSMKVFAQRAAKKL